ncbi:hypothetical protein G6F57_006539 [Rhizopus arrhizus]|uniref:Protein phosphatase n=1 Tax=Rhizopus oryzae TaxID=64495 RepID=A0A9P7BSC4_RHIOR|nr:hypothetical protein G6F23_007102 [Rhizopus arrhizus]KAG1427143.1 hypothetical protein G6F58_001158 [Rhizopus delemar]KAG0942630.1 hypothetical protein G6F30_005651 [Rhizopus arrhizus]KAG0946961.1 hypothetical protein G6F32_006366 [Rhizopus arrhizus]KAG0988137.1 hypothetical protein G6F29_001976 [Rhizopus arrhizus]
MKTWNLFASTLKYRSMNPPILLPPHPTLSFRQHHSTLLTTQPPRLPLFDYFAHPKQAPSYTFLHGASGFAKKPSYTTPDTKKRDHYLSTQVGEDAYFIRSDALGVADGVGGWSGVTSANAALYSRKLMHHAYLELEKFKINDPYFHHTVDPVSILQKSYEESMLEAKKEGILGSCTACLAILCQSELKIAHLGDCGISIIRHHDYVFQSEEQQHSFNFPFQLGSHSPDQPKDAQSFTVRVEKGDIIIMGSDGLFDNLFDKDILSIVRSHVVRQRHTLPFEPQKISDELARRANRISRSKMNVDCPFQEKAMGEGLYYQGGKADDISVIVAVVQD